MPEIYTYIPTTRAQYEATFPPIPSLTSAGPLVEREAVALPPALTISARVLLGVTAGWLGILLASPLTAAAIVLVRMLYVEDVLHDRASDRERRAA